MKSLVFRASELHHQKFQALGGAEHMRQYLDAAPWPRGTKPK